MKKYFFAAGILFFIAAIFSLGYFHPDEHYQILEFAAYKLGKQPAANLPWEFQEQMRSGFQPFIAYCVIKSLSMLSIDDPFWQATFLRLIAGFFNFYCILYLYKGIKKSDDFKFVNTENFNKYYIWLALLLWYIPFLSVRFSSESFSMAFTALAMGLWLHKKPIIFCGMALGFAFLSRYQVAFMIGGFGLYLLFIEKKIRSVVYLTFGFLIVLLIGVWLDHWLYGKWCFTPYTYFAQNLLEGKAASFGVYPWYFYIERSLGNALPPISLVIVFGVIAFFFMYPKHWLSFLLLPFLLGHFIVGHKEMRFIFSMIHFVPLALVVVFYTISTHYKWAKLKRIIAKNKKWILPLCITVNCLALLLTCFFSINFNVPVEKYVYDHYQKDEKIVCIEKSPFEEGGNRSVFYDREKMDVETRTTDSAIHTIDHKGNIYIIAKAGFKPTYPKEFTLCYSTLPVWMTTYLNFNHWVDRSDSWVVYKSNWVIDN